MTPREDRSIVAIAGTLQRQGGAVIHVQVVNLSKGGCRVRYKKTLWIGELVQLRIADQPSIRAQVRWSLLGNAGLKFVQP